MVDNAKGTVPTVTFSSPAIKRNHLLTTSVDFLDHKMSSSMFAEIPKLTSSTDYPRWAQTITAYLGVQKAWKTIVKTCLAYIKVEGADDNQAEIDAWEEAEGVARGVIILSLHPTIAEAVDVSRTRTFWNLA